MEILPEEQVINELKKANRVLIALPKVLHLDAAASALALAKFLEKLGKEAEVATAAEIPAQINFLPGADKIKHKIASSKSLAVILDTTKKALGEISYQTHPDRVNIFLKPKEGEFTPADISFQTEKFPYDIAVIIDCRNLEDLGEIFEQAADVFYETPKINIDNHPGNEYFGVVNLVDIKTTSVAEMLVELLQKFEKGLLDEDIATCLLAGIIARTHSFQRPQTTPQIFLKASELVALGGRQQEIVRHLYKTRSLPLLRLWGRALARLKIFEEQGVAYAVLSAQDFERSGAQAGDLSGIILDLVENISGYKVAAVIAEGTTGARLLLAAHPQADILALEQKFGIQARDHSILPAPFKLIEAELKDVKLQDAERLLREVLKLEGPAV